MVTTVFPPQLYPPSLLLLGWGLFYLALRVSHPLPLSDAKNPKNWQELLLPLWGRPCPTPTCEYQAHERVSDEGGIDKLPEPASMRKQEVDKSGAGPQGIPEPGPESSCRGGGSHSVGPPSRTRSSQVADRDRE